MLRRDMRAFVNVCVGTQGEVGGPGQKGSKGDKGELVSSYYCTSLITFCIEFFFFFF